MVEPCRRKCDSRGAIQPCDKDSGECEEMRRRSDDDDGPRIVEKGRREVERKGNYLGRAT
jgi:hypothetical protein